jgi:hypothetical protein
MGCFAWISPEDYAAVAAGGSICISTRLSELA